MWPSLLSLLVAFPPMSPANTVAPHHYGSPLRAPVEATVATWNGEAWAFWVDSRRDVSLGAQGPARDDLWMARIGPDGTPVDAFATLGCLAPPGFTFEQPRAVSLRSGLAVAWVQRAQTNGAPAVRVAAMNANGQLACPDQPQFSPPTLLKLEAGSNGTTILVAWSNAAQLDVRELSVAGRPLDGGVNQGLTPGSGTRPAVASRDGGYVVSWVTLDGGVAWQPVSAGSTPQYAGPGSAVALVERSQGTALGFVKGSGIVTGVLPANTAQNLGLATAVLESTSMLLAPWDTDALLALGSSTAGSTWSIGLPGQTFPAARDFVPGYRPRALSGLAGGALALAQQPNADTAPLSAFVLGSDGNTSAGGWDGGALVSTSANQWNPSVVWANGWWMIGHDEASVPESLDPEFHQLRLDPNSDLAEGAWFDIRPTMYGALVSGGGRLALLGTLNGETTLTELTHAGDQYAMGAVLARANQALSRGAVGALDALLWSPGSSNGFTALHAVAGTAPNSLTYLGVPGRCAALVERTFFLPVWSGPTLQLLPFDGASTVMPSPRSVRSYPAQGHPACAAANGTKVLVTWSNGPGIAAVIVDALTNEVVPVDLRAATDSGDVRPVVADTVGGWVLAWEVLDEGTGRSTIHGTFVGLDGLGDATLAKLGLDTVHSELRPALASSPSGQVALAWSTFSEVSGQTTTHARVIGTPSGRADAGQPGRDGGMRDGGPPPVDGGAGTGGGAGGGGGGGSDGPDAGVDGLVQFESCGCSGLELGGPSLLALFLWARRRRRPG